MKGSCLFDSPISVHDHSWKKKIEIEFVLRRKTKVTMMDKGRL